MSLFSSPFIIVNYTIMYLKNKVFHENNNAIFQRFFGINDPVVSFL